MILKEQCRVKPQNGSENTIIIHKTYEKNKLWEKRCEDNN